MTESLDPRGVRWRTSGKVEGTCCLSPAWVTTREA